MMKHIPTIILVLCTGLAISCSPGAPPEQAGGKPAAPKAAARTVNACDLVTLDDVREYYGAKMALDPSHTSTDRGPGADLSKCYYLASEGYHHTSVNVVARVSHAGEDAYGNHDLFIKQSKEELPDFKYEEVEGLGAPAIWQTMGATIGDLTVFLGTARLNVVTTTIPGMDRKEIALALMKKELARFKASQ
jgi:hypothetical protein